MAPSFGDGIVTFARVVGSVGGDAGDLLIGRNLAQQLWRHGASPMSLLVTSTALISMSGRPLVRKLGF